jgi:hypothetical protein
MPTWQHGKLCHPSALLELDSPLVLEEVQCIQMPDGTKIYMDGTVEYAIKGSLPSAALDYQSIASDKGVYAYYGDFDADGVEDMAVWYDGAFRGRSFRCNRSG